MASLKKVLILYTGGTFGMDEGQRLPKLSAPRLKSRMLQFVPDLDKLAYCDVEIDFNRDSAHIGPPEWILLAEQIRKAFKKYDGIVLLHGTDTLTYTASALSFLLGSCPKPVILTGAQKPLAALRTDARRNLVSAVEIAAHGPRPLVNQVCIFFDDRLLQGNRARKRSATEFNAFETPKAAPLAVVGTTIRYAPAPPKVAKPPKLEPRFDSRVAMIHLTPGFPAALFSTTLLKEVSAIVLVTFPSGTGPTHDPAFIEFLRAARKARVPIVTVTEGISDVPTGSGFDPCAYEAGEVMLKEGVIWAREMTPEAAFVKLSLILGQRDGLDRFQDYWKRTWAGEG